MCKISSVFVTAKNIKTWASKVQQKNQTITPSGGISFVSDEFTSSGVSALIDRELGSSNISGLSVQRYFPHAVFHILLRRRCSRRCSDAFARHAEDIL
jgi:hypothetical protein